LKANAATNTVGNIIGVAAEYYAGSATTKTDLAVWPGEDQVYVIQSDGSLTNRASFLHRNFPVVSPAGGNTASGLSTMELDASGGSITATNQAIKVIGFQLMPGDTVATTNVNCLAQFVHGSIWQHDATIT
jgi:hypothetical protein